MEFWTDVRRQVLVEGLSKRAAVEQFKISWHTLEKILKHEEPPGYQQKQVRPKPKIEGFLPVIDEILRADQKAPRKQRHSAKRIFERLRDEHQFTGGYTIVKDAVRDWRESQKEVFLPLTHRPGEAQMDWGFAKVMLRGQAEPRHVAIFVLTLPFSGAVFCQVFHRECTESFQEGHRRAFEFFGGVPGRIAYDNSKVAIAKILGSRDRKLTREFQRLQSHDLFTEHFCLVRRPNGECPAEMQPDEPLYFVKTHTAASVHPAIVPDLLKATRQDLLSEAANEPLARDFTHNRLLRTRWLTCDSVTPTTLALLMATRLTYGAKYFTAGSPCPTG